MFSSKPLPSKNGKDLLGLIKPILDGLKTWPRYFFVDDYKKWHKSFEQLVRDKWPESRMRVGQDVEH